jgi:hypothetical protein
MEGVADSFRPDFWQERLLHQRYAGCGCPLAQRVVCEACNNNRWSRNAAISQSRQQFQTIHPRHVVIDEQTALGGQLRFVQELVGIGVSSYSNERDRPCPVLERACLPPRLGGAPFADFRRHRARAGAARAVHRGRFLGRPLPWRPAGSTRVHDCVLDQRLLRVDCRGCAACRRHRDAGSGTSCR